MANYKDAELDTRINIAKDLEMANTDELNESLQLLDRTLRLLNHLTLSLRS